MFKYFQNKYRLRLKECKVYAAEFKKMIRRSSWRGKKIKRTAELLKGEYEQGWSSESYATEKFYGAAGPMRVKNSHLVLWRRIDRKKLALREIAKHFAAFRPETVLEVGSGSGLNILALAVMCPWVKKWQGVELTQAGIEASRRLLNSPPFIVLIYLTGESKETIENALKSVEISFNQGDMLNLPYKDDSFDCIFSQHAIEQLPRDYHRAFSEIKRVTARQAVFVEPFAEAQRSFFHWLYAASKDYFRFSYKEVEKAGFKVLLFEPLISSPKHCSGLLICK